MKRRNINNVRADYTGQSEKATVEVGEEDGPALCTGVSLLLRKFQSIFGNKASQLRAGQEMWQWWDFIEVGVCQFSVDQIVDEAI